MATKERVDELEEPSDSLWFARFLRKKLDQHSMSTYVAADEIGREVGRAVNAADVQRWLRGATPKMDKIIATLRLFGGDIERAAPEYNPVLDPLVARRLKLRAQLEGSVSEVWIMGTIGRGGVVHEREQKAMVLREMYSAKTSGLWNVTGGDVLYYTVEVDGLGNIPRGSQLFFRQPILSIDPPDATIVILRSQDGSAVMRRLRYIPGSGGSRERLISSVEPESPIQPFPKSTEVSGVLLEWRVVCNY